MVTYCPLPPRVSTWIGTGVALALEPGRAEAAGDAPVAPPEPCGAQPAATSTSPRTGLTERIGAYYGKRERNDLEAQREEHADGVDPAVDQQGDQGGGQAEAERPRERGRPARAAEHRPQHDRERERQGHERDDTPRGCESYRERVRVEGHRRPR